MMQEDLDLVEEIADLEEKNLFLINQKQEYEVILEEKKHEFDKIRKHYSQQVQESENNLNEVLK